MHRNARLTPQGRLLLCQRIEGGWPVAHAAAAMGISRDLRLVAPLSGGGPSRTRGSLVSAEAVPHQNQGLD
jgi:hypothetical protein